MNKILTKLSPLLLPLLVLRPKGYLAPTIGNFGMSKLFNVGKGGKTGATTSSGRLYWGAANACMMDDSDYMVLDKKSFKNFASLKKNKHMIIVSSKFFE